MIYFSMGGWCGKISNYMGHWCPTKSNYMGGWYFAAWKGKERILSAKKKTKKERSFIRSSQKKALSLANRSGRPFLFTRNCQTLDVSVEYW